MKSVLSYLPVASGVLLLVLSIGFGIVTLSQKGPIGGLAIDQNLGTKAAVAEPSLSLSPASQTYTFSPGQTYSVGVILDSAGKSVDGADVVLRFDPKMVRILNSQISSSGMFSETPLNRVDTAGKIQFSALTFAPKPVNGILASFRFQPLSAGVVNFSFDYSPGSTVDSNVAEHGSVKDALGKVTGATYTFR